ncbi:MAG: DUF4242 domain-containing protein [Alphaproteobacteria bacterium]
MEHVISERVFDTPMTVQRYGQLGDEGKSCLDLYGVTYRGSYLGLDGSRAICVFLAPDAEAVRNVGREVPIVPATVWTGHYFHPPETADIAPPGRQTVVVERSFTEPATIEDLQAREDASSWCLDMHDVRFLKTYVALDRRRMICFYTAPDAEAVRKVHETTGLPYDRAWAANTLGWPSPAA